MFRSRNGWGDFRILMIVITLVLLAIIAATEMCRRSYEREQRRERSSQESSPGQSTGFYGPLNDPVQTGPPESFFPVNVVYRVTNLALDEKTGLGLAWVQPENGRGFATWHPDVIKLKRGVYFRFVLNPETEEKELRIVSESQLGQKSPKKDGVEGGLR